MAITDEEYSELKADYYSRSNEIAQIPFKLSSMIAVASGLPLFVNNYNNCSKLLFKFALISASMTILLEFIRLHLNLKHIDIIVHKSEDFNDWSPGQTCYGKIGSILFWIRSSVMLLSLVLFVIGISLL